MKYHSEQNQRNNTETFYENLFFACTILFNLAISVLYIAVKLSYNKLILVTGAIAAIQIIPFAITSAISIRLKFGRKRILQNLTILSYLAIEVLFDYILKIPFREILWLHTIYIIVFYMAEYSMLNILWKLSRQKGILALVSFIMLIICLIYLYC